MITESQYSNSLQRYGKKRTDAIFNAEKSLGQDYLYKMCQFVYDEHIDLRDVISLFRRVRAMSSNLQLGNINQMSYSQLCKSIGGISAEDYIEIPNVVYQSEDGMVTIGKLNNKMEAESLNITNSWCISRKNDPHDSFNELSKNSVFYIIRNLNFSISSELRFVVCQVYNNNAHILWTQKNDILKYEDEYLNTLGNGASVLTYNKEDRIKHQENCSMNRRTIALTESRLRGMIREAVKGVLVETYNFASSKPQFNINGDTWKSNFDKMADEYHQKERKNDADLMDLQVAHHNGLKGKGGYKGDLSRKKRQSKKEKAESFDTVLSSGLRRVNSGIEPSEAFYDFEPFTEEQQLYMSDYYILPDWAVPLGTVWRGTYMLIYDTKNNKYVIPNEPLEL